MQQGYEIVNSSPANLELLPEALTYFTKALALQPRSQSAGREQQLLKLFLEGQSDFYQDDWDEAIDKLSVVYNNRPGYLDNTVVKLLYDAYVRSGDMHKGMGDAYLAYELYRKASELPLGDVAWARGRMLFIEPFLTPTPTPTITPTPRPRSSGGGGGGGGGSVGVDPTPLALSLYRGKILFMSDQRNLGEIWVMNPDGSERQPLGRTALLREQFESIEEQERFSPDSLRFAFSQIEGADPNPQIYLTLPPNNRPGGVWYTKLTELPGNNYDPVWSPDGTRVAFVSDAIGSDDIWVVNTDATYPHPLSPNEWEWDRHPSWSPDSQYLVFYSNRSGIMQIYIMRTDQDIADLEVINISNTSWDEYDPIWVK
jgi:TolB protein